MQFIPKPFYWSKLNKSILTTLVKFWIILIPYMVPTPYCRAKNCCQNSCTRFPENNILYLSISLLIVLKTFFKIQIEQGLESQFSFTLHIGVRLETKYADSISMCVV